MIIDIIDIIENYSDVIYVRLLNKYVYNNLPIKKIYKCENCKKYMINDSHINIHNGCIYCSKKQNCQECGKNNFIAQYGACCDWQCCYKYICYNGCSYKCQECGIISDDSENVFIIDHCDGSDDSGNSSEDYNSSNNEKKKLATYICNQCNINKSNVYKKTPHVWYGLSYDEYEERYG